MTGSTEHLLGPILFCAFWVYAQTVWLVFESLGLKDPDAFGETVIERGLQGFANTTGRKASA